MARECRTQDGLAGWQAADQGDARQQRKPDRHPPSGQVEGDWTGDRDGGKAREAHIRWVDGNLAEDGNDVVDARIDHVHVPPEGRQPDGGASESGGQGAKPQGRTSSSRRSSWPNGRAK